MVKEFNNYGKGYTWEQFSKCHNIDNIKVYKSKSPRFWDCLIVDLDGEPYLYNSVAFVDRLSYNEIPLDIKSKFPAANIGQ